MAMCPERNMVLKVDPTPRTGVESPFSMSIAGRYEVLYPERESPHFRSLRAFDRVEHREVSIWVVRPALDPQDAADFCDQARRSSLMKDGLRPILEAGIDERRPYVVVPAVDGETLAARIKRAPIRRRDELMKLARE